MGEWISVKERLPKDNIPCLVFRPDAHLAPNYDPNITIKVYSSTRGEWIMSSVQPTHWMPLLNPPLAISGDAR